MPPLDESLYEKRYHPLDAAVVDGGHGDVWIGGKREAERASEGRHVEGERSE